MAHNNLGNALRGQGKLTEAITEFRAAIQLKPDDPVAHYNLGTSLHRQGKTAEAIAAYHEAIQLKPDYLLAHCILGQALLQEGLYAEALAELRLGHELGSKTTNWRFPTAEWVHQAERLVQLDRKFPAILKGHESPADATEALGFAQLGHQKKLHGFAARCWTDAFQAQPALADDLKVQNRYNAACDAALAGCGQGRDDPPLGESARSRWRQQALDWLRADLAAWNHQLESGKSQARGQVRQALQHWRKDPDLAGLRDEAALTGLTAAERKEWRGLWAEVGKRLDETAGGSQR
jgi:serine/threonine-protein kinase